MKLPKIKNEQLPPELREILGDGDAEFDAIVDPMDVLDIQLDPDAYYEDRHKTALMLVEARKKLNAYRSNETQGYDQNSKENSAESKGTYSSLYR